MQSRDNAFPNLSVDESLKLAEVDDPPENVRPVHGAANFRPERRRAPEGRGGVLVGQRSTTAVTILDEPFGMLDIASIPNTCRKEIAANKSAAPL